MLKICKENKQSILEKVKNGHLDTASLCSKNLIDEIILAMYTNDILSYICKSIPDKRAHNKTIPYDIIWAISIAAKMKIKTSLTDIPYAINDHRTLAKLGYTLIDNEKGLNKGLMQEGSLRFLFGKYNPDTLFEGYNLTVQKYIIPKFEMEPNIHILDCTDLEVNFFNTNYENAGIACSKRTPYGIKENARGYKLSTLRGIVNDGGLIEEIRFGPLNIHDLALSGEMLQTTSILKPGDILINDRGFLSRRIINYLKTKRKVDTYIPLKQNMEIYKITIQIAKEQNEWIKHPVNRYRDQKVCLVKNLGLYWTENSKPSDNDVEINACVVWDRSENKYFVFATTDTSQPAINILKIYCLRPEIEEDYRQLKEFWKIEDFKSTKLNIIAFHIVSVLFGYLFFQLFTMLPDGEQYSGKSLPIILKNFDVKIQGFVILYVESECGVITIFELIELYANSNKEVKEKLKPILERL